MPKRKSSSYRQGRPRGAEHPPPTHVLAEGLKPKGAAHVHGLHLPGLLCQQQCQTKSTTWPILVLRVEEEVATRLSSIISEQVTAAPAQHQPTDADSQNDTEAEFVAPSATRPPPTAPTTSQGQATSPLTLGQLVSEADTDGTTSGPDEQLSTYCQTKAKW